MPGQKLYAVVVAGAVTTIIVWVVQQFWHVEIPTLVQGAITTVFSFVAGYLTPRSYQEIAEIATQATGVVVTAQQVAANGKP